MAGVLFCSGTARGGTNLLNLILSVHPQIQVYQDPLLPFFKMFRSAVMKQIHGPIIPISKPLDEYYYFDEKLAVLNAIQASNLDISFQKSDFKILIEELRNRMSFSSPKLIPYLDSLSGGTYASVFQSTIRIMEKAWGKTGIEWPGFNENWAIEFFKPVSVTRPDAKFIVLIRDVRAAIASHMKLVSHQSENPLYQYEKGEDMIALVMSFARCWRKQVAFLIQYSGGPFNDRLHWLRYEDLVSDPEKEIVATCKFLGVDYSSDMIETESFISPDGSRWLPNSNHYGVSRSGIYTETVEKWKTTLPLPIIELIEFICAPELDLLGYEVEIDEKLLGFPVDAYRAHVEDHMRCSGWRTDNHDPDLDFAFELLRRTCIQQTIPNAEMTKRCFLFESVVGKLKSGKKFSSYWD
jgi:hypothetical protein